MRKASTSSSFSSITSTNNPAMSTASSLSKHKRKLSTDLRLGLSISASHHQNDPSTSRGPINYVADNEGSDFASFFVKVYMEGIPIGRKINLLAHDGYFDLIKTLDYMFDTTILWGDDMDGVVAEKCHVLTYEDDEGDLIMVGDVPWEIFLSTVKRLKITRLDTCPLC